MTAAESELWEVCLTFQKCCDLIREQTTGC